MSHRVALLGSINVGGNKLKMGDLKAALEKDGFAHVSTIVASGNVLFEHPMDSDTTLEARIAEIVLTQFGISSLAVVRTKAELEQALEESPFAGKGEDKLVHVQFLKAQPAQTQFEALVKDHKGRGPEKLAPGTRALHIDYVSGVGSSKLTGAFIEKRLGCKGTARNVRSIQRIIEKFP